MRRLPVIALTLVVCLLAACGGNMTNPANSASVALLVQDTPPTGVTILRFEISVTAASVQPSDASAMAVSLINVPTKIELEELETETAFLNTSSAPAGPYSSISVTFANPEMTILNQSGQAIVNGATTCQAGSVCKLSPPLNSATATVNSAPFPITIGSNSQSGLVLDFNVNSSVQGNLSITPTLTVKQVTAAQQRGELEEMDDLVGSVSGVTTNQFTLMDNTTGKSFTINTNTSTEFEFDSSCPADNLSCLTSGEIVKVDVRVMADGTLTARKVELEEHQNTDEVEGTIVSVNAVGNQFQFVALDDEPVVANVTLGVPITVTVQQGATFEVDADGLNIPSSLSFTGIANVIVGQKIQIHPVSVAVGPPIAITTDRVRLRTSQIAGVVASTNPPNFILNNLPGLLTGAGISQIQVVTSLQTDFDGVNGVAGLTGGMNVAVRGLLFGPASGPTLVAAKVRSRSSN